MRPAARSGSLKRIAAPDPIGRIVRKSGVDLEIVLPSARHRCGSREKSFDDRAWPAGRAIDRRFSQQMVRRTAALEPIVSNHKGVSMKLAESIIDQVADAIIYADRSGVIIRWNRASTAAFGFSAEEALGQSLDLIIPEHLRAAHWRGYEAAITKGAMKLQGRPTLTRALHKSGRKLYVEMTFAIVRGETEDDVLGSVAMARDVTDRVERERAASRAS
jgi:PAS domain S-box-containing protein